MQIKKKYLDGRSAGFGGVLVGSKSKKNYNLKKFFNLKITFFIW